MLVTTTYAGEPIVRGEWLPEGMLVVAMGADSIHKRELDPEAILRADKVYVDSRSQNEILAEVGPRHPHRPLGRPPHRRRAR